MQSAISKEAVLEQARMIFGVVPGVIREAAERSAPVAWLYTAGTEAFMQASFSPIEMNAIELKVSALNHCDSCIRGHSYLLKQEGLSEEDIRAIIAGKPTGQERIDQLLQATEYVFHAGHDLYPAFVLDYLDQHISGEELADIIGLIALKTISNYLNNYLASVKQMAG